MNKQTVYPLKIINTFFFTLFIWDIFLSFFFLFKIPDLAMPVFLAGLGLTVVFALPHFLLHNIRIDPKELIVKSFGFRGYRKNSFRYRSIVKLEVKEGKAYFGIRRYYFAIHFRDGREEKTFILNEERYRVKDLLAMFKYVSKTHHIPMQVLS